MQVHRSRILDQFTGVVRWICNKIYCTVKGVRDEYHPVFRQLYFKLGSLLRLSMSDIYQFDSARISYNVFPRSSGYESYCNSGSRGAKKHGEAIEKSRLGVFVTTSAPPLSDIECRELRHFSNDWVDVQSI